MRGAGQQRFCRLLKEAGLRDARLHVARPTAATVLLVLRRPTPTVMSPMGWSSESLVARYQHVTDAMRSQVAGQVGERKITAAMFITPRRCHRGAR